LQDEASAALLAAADAVAADRAKRKNEAIKAAAAEKKAALQRLDEVIAHTHSTLELRSKASVYHEFLCVPFCIFILF
jgi:hypothetical protein